ncbi:MAG: dihydroorotase [Patescibacteria group bacterium]|nr:dihydroorotase [Patescibacteria group bacterium]
MSKLVSLPGIVDPHVHFRTPGGEHKEDFQTGSSSALAGGVKFVLDMPNTNPATTTKEALEWKEKQIEVLYSHSGDQRESRIINKEESADPGQARMTNSEESCLNFGFHFGATNDNLEKIKKVEEEIASIKVYFGSSTGDLLVNDLEVLEKLMIETSKIITVHAEDEEIIQKNIAKYRDTNRPEIHSLIRDPDSAASAVEKLLKLVKKTGHKVYFCHISTRDEIDLIRKAKNEGLPVYAEATPHHLFLDDSAYKKWGNFVKVNPPLRSQEHVEALWEAVHDGTIDCLGSDHAPHLPKEKEQDYWLAPSGIPGTETMLPLMLNAVNEERLSLDRLIELMSTNPVNIFGLDVSDKKTIVGLDLTKEVKIEELHSKCGWSPYEGMKLKGWPVFQ